MFGAFLANLKSTFALFGLLTSPLLLFLGFGYIVLAFNTQASLVEIITFPVLGILLILFAISSLRVLPRVLNRYWFLLASMFHLYCGIDGLMTGIPLVVLIGLIFLLYSFIEFNIFRNPVPPIPASAPPPPDPS